MNTVLLTPVVDNKYGIPPSHQHLWAVLECFNPETCTFFIPIGELRMTLHEMEEVSGLQHGGLPYEERVPIGSELDVFAQENPNIYDVYWEVSCHFFICINQGERNHKFAHQASAKYLLPGVEGPGSVASLVHVASELAP